MNCLIRSRSSKCFYFCLGFSAVSLRIGCHLFLVCIGCRGSVLNTLSCFQAFRFDCWLLCEKNEPWLSSVLSKLLTY